CTLGREWRRQTWRQSTAGAWSSTAHGLRRRAPFDRRASRKRRFSLPAWMGRTVKTKFSTKRKKRLKTNNRRARRARKTGAKKGGAKEARNLEPDFLGAKYKSRGGWNGIPAAAFRMAMISPCRLVK